MLNEFINISIEHSMCIIPSFLLAIFISAVLTEIIPEKFFDKALSTNNFISVLIASAIGALIPLCTCGMIPLASKLQKKGVPWLIVVSFLTAGNASSITSIILTLVLGLKITFLRLVFAIIFGIIVSYLFVLLFKPQLTPTSSTTHKHECNGKKELIKKISREFLGLMLSFGPWILISIIFASLITMFISEDFVLKYSGAQNVMSPFLLILSEFPFYFCAGADIPITKILLEKGASLGSTLAFMTASGGVNLTSFFIYQKWLGLKKASVYLGISILVCGTMGLIINLVIR